MTILSARKCVPKPSPQPPCKKLFWFSPQSPHPHPGDGQGTGRQSRRVGRTHSTRQRRLQRRCKGKPRVQHPMHQGRESRPRRRQCRLQRSCKGMPRMQEPMQRRLQGREHRPRRRRSEQSPDSRDLRPVDPPRKTAQRTAKNRPPPIQRRKRTQFLHPVRGVSSPHAPPLFPAVFTRCHGPPLS